MKSVGIVLVAVACFCASAAPLAGQETISYGSISGRVTDPQGAILPGAHVSARQTETNLTREVSTDLEGRFRFPYLRVGHYRISVRLDGFAEATREVAVTVGSAFELPVRLALAGFDSSVTVTADASQLETARTQLAGTVSQAEVQMLPLNGRNFLDLALVVPGVSPTNTGSTQLFAETSAVPGQGISVASQRNFSNNFLVDGLSANDDAAGVSGIPFGVDAVEEFQVVTSGGQAELGRALGGYVSVVTKSGTNTTQGNVYDYVRDTALNARNPLSGTTLPVRQQQYGASAGGPIVRDRTFYFANAEQRRLHQAGLTTIAPANVHTVNARLRAVGYPGAPISTGSYAAPVDSTNVMVKLDHQFSPWDQFSARYALYDVSSRNSRGAGGLNAATASAGLDNRDQSIAFGNTLTLSSRTVNETRLQIVSSRLEAPPADPIGPAVAIAGIASFGTLSGSPHARRNTMFQIVNNVSHQAGAHAVRLGVDFIFNDNTITYPRSVRGAYTFSSLDTFLSGAYNTAGFMQTFGERVVSQTNPNVGFYVQDEWKAHPSLTFNAGVRYDLQYLDTIETDANNISPRLGFAWTPSDSRQTVIRGSAGLFFDRVPLRALANALLSAGNTTDLGRLRQVSISLSPGQSGAPVFPAILDAAIPSVTLPNLSTMDREIQNAYSRQASVEIERQVGTSGTVSVGYQYVRGDHLIIQLNQNVPACVAAGGNNGCRPNPAFANINQYSSEARSNYHGLHVSFVQRPARWGYYRVSYTLSKSMNNVGEHFFSSPIDPGDLSKDWGRSDDDQRHRLVVNGAAALPFGFHVSAGVQAYSSLPFNITSGVTTIQGTAGRPIVNGQFIPRNAGVGSDFFSASARVSRVFSLAGEVELETIAEVFNLTNQRNAIARNTNFGTGAYPANPLPSFGQVTAVGEPRSAQLAVRLRF
jgi:hypothetical protein